MMFLTIIGLVSFAVSELSALKSQDVKRIFAYSTLGQLGVIFAALSTADTTIISGAIFLILIHSIGKLMLFFSLDLIESETNSTNIVAFKSFQSSFLFVIFVIGFLSILGIPPFAGFIAKLTILKGFSSLGQYWVVGLILAISLIEATYFFRLLSTHDRSQKTKNIHIPLYKKIMLSFLAVVILCLGVFPQTFLDFCSEVANVLVQGVVHV
jgi:formate hydrogenlyase subunit 3/multisubunit Na+/H+ antiporter MnhD subunit